MRFQYVIQRFGANLKSLRFLSMAGQDDIAQLVGLTDIISGSGLDYPDFGEVAMEVSKAMIDSIADFAPGIQSLMFGGVRFAQSALAAIGRITSLRALHLRCSNTSLQCADGVSLVPIHGVFPSWSKVNFVAHDFVLTRHTLPPLKQLEEFSILSPSNTPVDAFFKLPPTLRKLRIETDGRFGGEQLKAFREFIKSHPNLEFLGVIHKPHGPPCNDNKANPISRLLAEFCPKMKRLGLAIPLRLKAVGHLRGYESIEIAQADALTADDVIQLCEKNPKLRHLELLQIEHLPKRVFTDGFARLTKLRSLDLIDEEEIDDAVASAIFEANRGSLREVNLGGIQKVTAASLRVLGGRCKKLAKMRIEQRRCGLLRSPRAIRTFVEAVRASGRLQKRGPIEVEILPPVGNFDFRCLEAIEVGADGEPLVRVTYGADGPNERVFYVA